MKLLIHSQIAIGYTVEVLEWINDFTKIIQWLQLHIHAGIKVKSYQQKGPLMDFLKT